MKKVYPVILTPDQGEYLHYRNGRRGRTSRPTRVCELKLRGVKNPRAFF